MRAAALYAFCMLLVGCGGQAATLAPSPRLRGPDAAVMTKSSPLPKPAKDEDAKELLKQCRAAHGEVLDKLEPLQNFARRVTRPQ